MKTLLNVAIAITLSLLFACGDSTGPSGFDLTPSTLSVTFTGGTGKTGLNGTSDLSASDIPYSVHSSTGAKSSCIVTASWTICTDPGFNSYVLYRSETENISSDPSSADILGEFTSANTTLYVDTDLIWATEYFYVLKNTGSDGNGVWSNEASITTPEVEAPDPSVLSNTDVSWFNADFSWTKCSNPNFASYRLYRSITPDIESDSTLAELICDLSWSLDTAYTDTTVLSSSAYYYALLTTNTEGVSSWSNEISLNTMTYIPYNVTETLYVGSNPWGICSLPSGEYVYVTNRGDDNVSVIRTSDNTITATVNVGDIPYGICSLPSGEYLYVTNCGSDNVSVIRTSDNTVTTTIPAGDRPVGICTLPSGEYLYVTNRDDDNVSLIRTSDNTVVATVDVGITPYRICTLPSGDYVYVTNWNSNTVSVIRTSDNSVVKTIDTFPHPIGICSLPSGEYVYVSNYSNDVISVFRTSDYSLLETVNVGNGPWGLSVHPSGECVYVANSTDDTVSIIRSSDNKVITSRNVGGNPSGICSLPSGETAYIVNYNDGTVSVLQ